MVQKYQSPVRVYKYPFELVMKVNMQPEINSWMEFRPFYAYNAYIVAQHE